MTDRQGQQLDSYRLIRLLGAGSFGEVYLAQHVYRTSQAPVAIKVLSPLTQDDLLSFLGEARITRLKHPNIVQVLDFGIDGRIPFIVMEYAPNGTLRQFHPKGSRVPLPTIVSYVKQLASALQYAHDERLIHRDIKPENMLIGEHNQILLSDFGVATIARSMQSQSVEQIAGTVPYMAPEQIESHPHPASDQYSLGVVVYEWLCGERPFQGTLSEVAVKHATVPPPPLREKIPTISPDIEQIVMKALAKDHKQRFDSILAFADILEYTARFVQAKPLEHVKLPVYDEQVITSLSSSSLPQSTIPGLESTCKVTTPQIARRRIILGLGTGLLVGVGSLTLLVLSHRVHIPSVFGHTSTPVSSPKPTSTAIPWGSLLYTYHGHSALVNAVAWSPDGKRIVSGSDDKTVQVWDAANGGNVLTYSGHSDLVEAVVWSPNGKRIASGSFDAAVQVWDAVSGANPFIYHRHTAIVDAVAWSPDGKHLASGSYDKTVQIWDASSGDLIFTYSGHTKAVHALAWSPDGKRIASGSSDKTVQVWDAANGNNIITYQGHLALVLAVTWSPDGKRIASSAGGNDTAVQVWNASNGSHILTYQGHTDFVNTVAWSHDGKHIASGSNDKTVRVWNATDGSHAFSYSGHTSEVRAVTWSPDDERIASSGDDTTVQVWRAV